MEKTYCVFHATETGHRHLTAGSVCEDASGAFQNESIHICIVADGHGGRNYPRADRGARFAVEAARRCLLQFAEDVTVEDLLGDSHRETMLQLARSILNTWHNLVEDDVRQQEITETELEKVAPKYAAEYLRHERMERAYGTTLIAFAVAPTYALGIQIGDGTCVMFDESGTASVPVPDDAACQMNITTSLCDPDALREFRYFVTDKAPVAVFCGTDGVENSYSSRREVYALYRSIASIFMEYGEQTGKNELADYLPVLTRKGSGDDVSVAGIIDQERLPSLRDIFALQTRLFQVQEERMAKQQRMALLQNRPTHPSGPESELETLAEEINALTQLSSSLEESLAAVYTEK